MWMTVQGGHWLFWTDIILPLVSLPEQGRKKLVVFGWNSLIPWAQVSSYTEKNPWKFTEWNSGFSEVGGKYSEFQQGQSFTGGGLRASAVQGVAPKSHWSQSQVGNICPPSPLRRRWWKVNKWCLLMWNTLSSCNNPKIASSLISVYKIIVRCWPRIKLTILVHEETGLILLINRHLSCRQSNLSS